MIYIFLLVFVLLCALDQRLKVVNFTIQSHKVDTLIRFAVIADYHSGKKETILKRLLEQKPDAILIVGDLFQERKDLACVDQLLEGAKKIAPIYFVTGNHEYKKQAYPWSVMQEILDKHGVIQCDNQSHFNNNIQITGIQDCLAFGKQAEIAWAKEKENIKNCCDKLDDKKFQLVLIHRPDHYHYFNDYNVDLMISGHAHGGQWRIPKLINGIYAPQQGFFPKRAGGSYTLPHGIQIVSRGLAFHWTRPRIFNRPELVVIDIYPNE